MDSSDDISLSRHFRETAKTLRKQGDRLHELAREQERLAEVYELTAKSGNLVPFKPRLVPPVATQPDYGI